MIKDMSKKQPDEQTKNVKQETHTWLFVVIAILLLLILVLLVWMSIHKMGDITLSSEITVENWFSYLVTLIGVTVTIFVGLQIYNTVEAKRAMKDTEEKYDELKKRTEETLNNFRKENMTLVNETNEFRANLLEKHYETLKKIDWDLKEVKKEYWNEITNMKKVVKNTEQTQKNIETKMNEINEKWEKILSVQDAFSKKMTDYKHDLANAFLQISKTFGDDSFLKVLTGLKSINLQKNFYGENIKMLLGVMNNCIIFLENNNSKLTKHRENIIQETLDLRNISIDSTDKHYNEVQEKIYKIARLAEQLPAPQEKDENYSR